MQTQYLNINEYKYKVEYIPYEECNSLELCTKQFVMIRNFSFMNNIVVDDNIYFIEKPIFELYKENCLNNDKENKYIIWPSNKDTMYYSSEYHIYNDMYIDKDLIKGSGVFDIYEKDDETDELKITNIKCDLVKIYHPSNKYIKNLIIHIENVINNIHFHYLCRNYQWYYDNNQYNSYEESKYENNIYSEYIKCYIPSINELFDRTVDNKFKLYFKETLNIAETISEENTNFINNIIINKNNNQYIPIALFTQPYMLKEYDEDVNNNNIIEKEEKIFKKVFFKYKISLDNSYITTPVNVSLYPYESLNQSTKIYSLSNDLLPNTVSLLEKYNFDLSSIVDFNEEGNISLICHFDYPFKEVFENAYGKYSLSKAYCFYNNINNVKAIYKTHDMIKEEYFNEIDEINSITDIDDETIKFLIDSNLAESNPNIEDKKRKQYYIDKLKESHWQLFLEEYIDEFKASIDFFGFRIDISSDKNFKNIILSKNISLLDNVDFETAIDNYLNNDYYIDIFNLLSDGNFFFPINGLFTDWKQMPDMIIARITFIDRLIGHEIVSNEVFISKEKFKYITNINKDFKRIQQLIDLNKNYNNDMIELTLNTGEEKFNDIISQIDNDELKTKLLEWFETYSKHQYSFINKINCKVNNNYDADHDNNLKVIQKNTNNQNIIYKPIFFKTNTLNNIQLKYKQNQNIGIDLHEYISKVDLFIITINGMTCHEIGRNSNYVLFNINTTSITDESGTYEIYNNDHEYITYGTWSIIR